MRGYRAWGFAGGIAGAAATAAFWLRMDEGRFAVVPLSIGFGLGALVGVVVGDGSVKREWAGVVGAFLLSAFALGVVNVVVILVLDFFLSLVFAQVGTLFGWGNLPRFLPSQ